MDAIERASDERFLILGTAGHIDHGKTSLVEALTGVNTDRLPEEQRRGMTIELGFAELSIGSLHFGVVDVPGHEKFVRTMVAGATGIDLALIVVAADDSVMPQTVEHVEVLRLCGLRHAVVAITKVDVVDSEMAALVEQEAAELLASTPLAGAPMVRVSSVTRYGIDDLKKTLVDVAARIPSRVPRGPFRMAVDRVFSVPGRGTVVTGSVLRGLVRSGDSLDIQPGGVQCRVREMQSHGQTREAIQLGQRAALNLIGVDRREIDRGCELATPDFVTPSYRVDASFEALGTIRRAIKASSHVRICMGTREVIARMAALERREIERGETAYVQLRSGTPFFAAYGQRFIAREENDARTIGGGVILRPVAKRWRADRVGEREALETLERGMPLDRLKQVLIEAGFDPPPSLHLTARTGIEPDELPPLFAQLGAEKQWEAIDATDRRVVPACVEALFDRADRWLERFHQLRPDEPGCHVDAVVGWFERKSAPGLGRPLFERYIARKRAKVHGRYVCTPAFAPQLSAQDERVLDAMRTAFRDGEFQPPSLEQLAADLNADVKRLRRLAKLAVAFGELVEIDGSIYLASEHETHMRETVTSMIREKGGATVAALRERLHSSRKYAVPFMEYLDRVRFTLRRGDTRVLNEESTA